MTSNWGNLHIEENNVTERNRNALRTARGNSLVCDDALLPACFSETDRFRKKAIEDALQFIRRNFARQIAVAEIAASVYMSTYHFCRIFKKYTGYAPHQYLLGVRLEYAAVLLTHSDKTITQIGSLSGFKRIGYFSAMFAKKYHVSPTVFRWQATEVSLY